MLTKAEAEKLGFRIVFHTSHKWRHDNYYQCSYNGGVTWGRKRQIYTEQSQITKHELGHFYVKQVLKPSLNESKSLCIVCANQGKIGIVKYAGIIEGSEKVAVPKYDADGCHYAEDIDVWCKYKQWKCTRCGDLADSDYA